MTNEMELGRTRLGTGPRIAIWAGVTALILMIPLVAMQYTGEVAWTGSDFIVAGALLFGIGTAYELGRRLSGDRYYRAGIGVALFGALFLVWANGAVGLVGNEQDDFNMLYLLVLAVGAIGAVLARFEAAGMARTLLGAALVQAALGGLALVLGLQHGSESSVAEILAVTGMYVAIFLVSAALFRNAAKAG